MKNTRHLCSPFKMTRNLPRRGFLQKQRSNQGYFWRIFAWFRDTVFKRWLHHIVLYVEFFLETVLLLGWGGESKDQNSTMISFRFIWRLLHKGTQNDVVNEGHLDFTTLQKKCAIWPCWFVKVNMNPKGLLWFAMWRGQWVPLLIFMPSSLHYWWHMWNIIDINMVL